MRAEKTKRHAEHREPKASPRPEPKASPRAERLKSALKANLARRKAQAEARRPEGGA